MHPWPKRRFSVLPFVVTVLFTSLTATAAEQVTVPRAGETIEVSIVNVDAVVTDRSGRRVRGLTKDDFEILQDGQPQPITNFAEYGPTSAATAGGGVSVAGPEAPTTAAAPAPPRTIVVFIDRFTLPPFQRDPMFAQLRTMLHQTVRPGDAVSIVSWRRIVVTRLPFTDDLAAVDRVLEQIRKESSFVMTASDQQQIEDEREWLQQVSQYAAGLGFQVDVDETITLGALDAATRARLEMKAKVRAINSLMRAISGVEGKKVLMLMTRRFSRVAGLEFLRGFNTAPSPKTSRELENDMQREIDSIVRTANANGVTIYALYPIGLGDDVTPDASRRQALAPTGSRDYLILNNELDAMKQVAEKTGGTLAWGAKDIIKVLPAVQEDFDSYYSLAYRATDGKRDDRARRIVVRVKQRGLTVRSRREAIEKSDVTKMKDRVVASLLRAPERTNLPFEVTLGTAAKVGRSLYRVPVTVRVPMRALLTLPQNGVQTGGFSVYIAWGGILGEMSDVKRETRTFTVEPGEADKAQMSHLDYTFDLVTDEKTDRISIGVTDEVTGEYGIRRIALPPRQQMVAERKAP